MVKPRMRTLSLLLCLLMVFCMFAGCGSSEKEGGDGGGSARDAIVIASSAEPPTLDPTNQTALMSMQMTLLMYNRLFTLDEDVNIVPSLVETYANVSDTEWEFTLHKGIKFHNGTDLTTEDVKATLEYCLTNSFAGPYVEAIKSIEIIDDYNFKIYTHEPSTALIPNLTQSTTSILPSELLAAGHDFNAEPCGSGPYKYVSWTSGDSLKFERFDDYFEGAAKIKDLTWKFIPEDSARTIALEAGDVDFLFNVASIDLPILESNADIEMYTSTSVNHYYMYFNLENEPYDNVLLRKAISAALDRESMVKAVLNGYGNAAYGCVSNNLPGENLENAVTYDVEQAKKYLAESGVDPSSFTLYLTCTDDGKRLVGAIIQSNLAEIGITVELESQDYATFVTASTDGDFIAGIGGIANNIALNFMRRAYHSSQIGAANFSRFSDPEIDSMIDTALMTLDDDTRMEMVSELEAKLNDLCVIIPLYQDLYVRAYNADLGGVTLNATYFTKYHELYWKS